MIYQKLPKFPRFGEKKFQFAYILGEKDLKTIGQEYTLEEIISIIVIAKSGIKGIEILMGSAGLDMIDTQVLQFLFNLNPLNKIINKLVKNKRLIAFGIYIKTSN